MRRNFVWAALLTVAVLILPATIGLEASSAGAAESPTADVIKISTDLESGVIEVGAAATPEAEIELIVSAPGANPIVRTYIMDRSALPRRLQIPVSDFDYAFGTYTIEALAVYSPENHVTLVTLSISVRPASGGFLNITPINSERAFTATLWDIKLPDGAPVWLRVWSAEDSAGSAVAYPMRFRNGHYVCSIPIDGRTAGRYQTAAYCGTPGTNQSFVQTARFEISGVSDAQMLVVPLGKTDGHVRVTAAAQAPAGIVSLRAAVWFSADQSDLRWYDMHLDGQVWITEFDVADHAHQLGSYKVHVWATLGNGASALVAGSESEISFDNYAWAEKTGRYANVCIWNPKSGNLQIALWSNMGGQDDLRVYPASTDGNGLWKARVPLRNHPEPGTYTAQITVNGTPCAVVGFDLSEHEVARAREMRGLWVPSVLNLDFPTVKGAAAQQQEFREIVRNAQSWGINTLFVQVRPHADALYESALQPWSKVLTGNYDESPGYDPLAFMIQTAHDAGIELHAWLNPYRVCNASEYTRLSSRSVCKMHPDWLIWHNNAACLDPANPSVRNHIAATVQEIVDRYDVDGIHFDDYFYPYNYPLPDGEPRDGVVGNARRDAVTEMVRMVSSVVRSSPKNIQFGISPCGIWKNVSSDPAGSATRGMESYYSNFCDTVRWINEDLIDYVAPQIYWHMDHSTASYRILADWWAHAVAGTDVDLVIGQGVYKSEVAAEIDQQLALNDQLETAGSIFYRYADVRDNQALAASLSRWSAR